MTQPTPAAADAGAVRLTRRGRLALVVLLLALVTGGFMVASPVIQAAPVDRGAPTTVVRPGDTLWSIAERHAPRRERFEVIEEIRHLNRLRDYTVHPGQRLVLPRRR